MLFEKNLRNLLYVVAIFSLTERTLVVKAFSFFLHISIRPYNNRNTPHAHRNSSIQSLTTEKKQCVSNIGIKMKTEVYDVCQPYHASA